MEKVEVKKMYDILIIEKYENPNILKGSNIFCGCCGEPIGKLKEDVKFPCRWDELKKELENCTLERLMIGFRHKTCGHTMFAFSRELGFTLLETYLEKQKKEENEKSDERESLDSP